MELKQTCYSCIQISTRVLIVPYGIETRKHQLGNICYIVLIVPYGIETLELFQCGAPGCVLIVPYGIETNPTC